MDEGAAVGSEVLRFYCPPLLMTLKLPEDLHCLLIGIALDASTFSDRSRFLRYLSRSGEPATPVDLVPGSW